MKNVSIPKFVLLFDRYPKPVFGSIGATKNPTIRWGNYGGCAEVCGKAESNPRVKNNELILFSCWSKFVARRYEYLMQFHTIGISGKFYKLIGHQMNPQKIVKPKANETNTAREAYYVYCQFTRSPFTFTTKTARQESSASTSTSSASTFTPHPTIELSDSDDHFCPVAQKKSRPRAILSSSSDEDIVEPLMKKKNCRRTRL